MIASDCNEHYSVRYWILDRRYCFMWIMQLAAFALLAKAVEDYKK